MDNPPQIAAPSLPTTEDIGLNQLGIPKRSMKDVYLIHLLNYLSFTFDKTIMSGTTEQKVNATKLLLAKITDSKIRDPLWKQYRNDSTDIRRNSGLTIDERDELITGISLEAKRGFIIWLGSHFDVSVENIILEI